MALTMRKNNSVLSQDLKMLKFMMIVIASIIASYLVVDVVLAQFFEIGGRSERILSGAASFIVAFSIWAWLRSRGRRLDNSSSGK